MKKFRLTALKYHTLMFFMSVESLYEWHTSVNKLKNNVDIKFVELNKDDFIDIEWLGCEIVYEKNNHICFNVVNAAVAHYEKDETTFNVQPIVGWIVDYLLPLKEVNKSAYTVKKLQPDEGLKLLYPFDDSDEDNREET